MNLNYKHTNLACYTGYITQALVITLPSLLFTVFFNKFGISLSELGLLITLNFCVQIIMDISSAAFITKTGYRIPAVIAHFCAFLGLVGLAVLPLAMPSHPYIAVCLPIFLSSVGGGLIEVLVSPIIDALPSKEKSASMSLLHSFFCWGQLATVLISTLYLHIFGMEKWYILPVLWSLVPLFNTFYFMKVPLPVPESEEKTMTISGLLKTKFFILFLILMLCAGASEQSMSQWASLFAETGLKVSKTTGDLLGLSLFAVLMGVSRIFYGIWGEKIDLSKFIFASAALCIISYAITMFSPYPIISLFGCALCGLSVGIMWPGTFSLAGEFYPKGGAAMFALLAFSGDIGCSIGPGMVGALSDFYQKTQNLNLFSGSQLQQGLKFGLLAAAIFPIILLITVHIVKKNNQTNAE